MPKTVRPFDRLCIVGDKTVCVHGTIEHSIFVVTAESIRIEVPSEIGRDKKGAFAILKKSEWPGSDGTVVRVDYDDHELVISKTKILSRKIGALEVAVACQEGLLPGTFIPYVVPESDFRICFDYLGNVENVSFDLDK